MLTQLVPSDATGVSVDPFSDEGLAWLHETYALPRREWLRLNFISSVTGSAAGPDGTSETLTSRIDRRILGVIRAQADLVLVGAQSVRAEGYRVPKTAPLGIVTASGRLDGHRLAGPTDDRLIVLCPESARSTVRDELPQARVITLPDEDGRLEASTILAAVRDAGYESVVCEGGPSLAAQFAASGLVDEVCLSTAPLVTPASLPMLSDEDFAPMRVRLHRLLVDDASSLYARWVRDTD